MRQLPERQAPTAEQFRREIVPAAQPVVLRNVAGDWPLVVAARGNPYRCMAIRSARASEAMVEIRRADPDEQGRFHYAADGRSLNFIRGRASLPVFLAALCEKEGADRPYAMVVQALVAEHHVLGFADTHPMPLAPPSDRPRLWIGNTATIATHNDPTDNDAVVVAGRRRFTSSHLRPKPIFIWVPRTPLTPAGTPVSMVHVTRPDPTIIRALQRHCGSHAKLSFRPAMQSSSRATGFTT